MNDTSLAALAISFALAASLSAQQSDATSPLPPAESLASLCTPIHSLPDDGGQPYGVWAAGARYKASFDGGMRFWPSVGPSPSAAPTLAWRTLSARVGEVELASAPAPTLTHGEWRAEYDLGGIVEAYDVRTDGLEQTFVLRERPPADGDLVIRGAVSSELQPQPAAGYEPVEFVDAAGRTVVRYGAAIAVDATGRSCAMTTTTVAGGIELRLAAGWLAHAAFPLVIDPLLTAVTVGGGASITEVAVAHDGSYTSNVWLAEVRVSGTDHDLRLFRTDETGLNPVLVFSDLSSSWSTIDPSLGVNVPAAKVMLAFTRHFVSSDTTRVRLHLHDRYDVGFDTAILTVPSLDNTNHWRPTVGNELSPISFTSLLVAYQVETAGNFTNGSSSAIHGVEVSCGGLGGIGSQFVIADVPAVDCERPTLSSVASGPTRAWTVAYQRYQHFAASGFEWDIAARRIAVGNVVGSEFLIDNGIVDQHEMAPKLAGHDNRLMLFCTASTIAESAPKPLIANGHRIRGTRLDWNGVAFLTPHGSQILQANADARLEIGGASYDSHTDGHWVLSFRSNATQTIYFRSYAYDGTELTSDVVETPPGGGTSVAGGVAFQTNDDEFLIAYGSETPGVNWFSRLRRRTYPPLSSANVTGSSCTSTQVAWYGARRIGTESCGVVFTNAPANSFTVCLAAIAPASLQLFGIGGVHDGCWLLVPLAGPDYLGMLPPFLGASAGWNLPLAPGLPNVTLRFQAVSYDPATNEFYSSSRLNVPIGM